MLTVEYLLLLNFLKKYKSCRAKIFSLRTLPYFGGYIWLRDNLLNKPTSNIVLL